MVRLTHPGHRRKRFRFEWLENRIVLDSTIVFSEIMYHPAGDEDTLEWIELFNHMSYDMDVSDWKISGGIDYTFAGGTVIDGRGYLVIAINPTELRNQTGFSSALGPFTGRLSNQGEELQLLNNSGRIMSRLDYRDGGEWPVGPDGMGFTLAKQEEFLSTEPAEHWATSSQLGGTPGEVNFVEHTGPTSEILVEPGETARVLIPSNHSLGLGWTQTSFNDASWTAGPTGVGYEVGAGTSVAYRNLVGAPGSAALPGPLGHDFVVNSTVTVTQLGVFDSGADGLSRTLTAELWSRSGNSGTKLADWEFTSSDPGTLVDSNRFKVLNPTLQLAPGDYTIVAHGYGSSERAGHEGFGGPGSSFKTLDDGGGAISFVGTSRLGTTAGSFPSIPDGGIANYYSAGTFQFTTSSTGNEIATNIESQIRGVNTTAYVRIPFNVNGTEGYQLMTLSMQYNDGFVAYLNGTEVVRRNAPASVTWNSAAVVDNTLVTHEVIDLSTNLSALRNGSNVLAVHGLNAGLNDQRFLVLPELEISGSSFQPELVINEVSAGDATDFFVEIANDSNVSQSVTAYVIASSSGADYVIPSQMIAAGGQLSISAAELGFTPADGDSLFLLSPSRGQLLDAQNVTGRLRGRSDQHDGRWLYPNVATPGAANGFDFHDEIVINELFYHPTEITLDEEVTTKLVTVGDEASVFIPTDNSLGTGWQLAEFDDTTWISGSTAIGFEAGGVSDAMSYGNLAGAVGSAQFAGPFGHDFVVNSAITITHLGVFDSNADGLARNLTAEVWSRNGNTGTQLTQLEFTTGDPGVLVDSNRMKPLATPLVLPAGDYTMVAHGYGSGEPVGNESFGGPAQSFKTLDDGSGAISFVGTSRLGTVPGNFPSIPDSGAVNLYSAGTFQFSTRGEISSLLQTDVGSQMHQVNSTAYVRIEFSAATPNQSQAVELKLDMKYDDGFVAYLNGTEIARRNAPTTLSWNSTATTSAAGANNLDTFDISVHAGSLLTGNNVLAIHGLNSNSADGDFFLAAELELTTRPPSQQEWLELYNRNTHTIDLSGWQLDRGIRYQFPTGTTLAPNSYLVVASNALDMTMNNPGIQVVGNFSGQLSNKGEFVRLVDDNNNPVDEVHYHDRGNWPGFADGGGSSLELRDPDADNSRAEVWAASDESRHATWKTYSVRGTGSQALGPTNWNELILGMLDSGEVLLDDITVVEDPDGANKQLIQNGTFESDPIGGQAASWRITGNHQGTVVQDPSNPTNQVLHLVASGTTSVMSNNAETTLKEGNTFVNLSSGKEYEITLRAKWLGGSNQLHSRLYFNRLPTTFILQVPQSGGTPGLQNSTFTTNIGPTYHGFSHLPVVPAATETVTVSVMAKDPDGIDSMTLWWSVDEAAWQSTSMSSAGSDLYTANIPGQPNSAVVQFYVEGRDSNLITSNFPAAGPDSRALYKVRNAPHSTDPIDTIEIVMLQSDSDSLYVPSNLMSNKFVGATVLHNHREAFYDVGAHLRGSVAGRNFVERQDSFLVALHPDQLFRGVHDALSLDGSGAGPSGNQQDEILMAHLWNRAGHGVSFYHELVYLSNERSQHNGPKILQLARYDDLFLEEQFGDDSDGTVFDLQIIRYETATSCCGVEGPKLTLPEKKVGRDISNFGDDKEAYRWTKQITNQRVRDDYSSIVQMSKAFDLTGSALDDATQEVMDIDSWMRTFAFYSLIQNSDAYTYCSTCQHNVRFYVRPSDQKVMALPWDMDHINGNPTAGLHGGDNLAKIIDLPANLRLFYGHIHDFLSTSFEPTYLSPWISHYGSLTAQNYSGNQSFLSARFSHMNNLLPAQIAFDIDTSGPLDVGSAATATIQGKGWINVRELRLAGSEQSLGLDWTVSGGAPYAQTWTTTIPVSSGTNSYTFEAYDYQGDLIGSDSISVTTRGGTPVQSSLRISELMFNQPGSDDAEFIELLNLSTNQTIDLAGIRFSDGINFTFSSGSLAPGERVVVTRDVTAFQLVYGAGINVVGPFASGGLNNTGETIELTDSVGFPIQIFSYSGAWFPHTDGDGYSLTAVDAMNPLTDLNLYSAWRPSNLIGGSPGTGDMAVAPGSVVINEVMANPINDPDGDWIELANTSASAVDIGHWYLSNTDTNRTLYQIDPGTVIPAGGLLVLTENDEFGTSFTLSDDGDSVLLSGGDHMGNVLGYRDQQESFSATSPAESIGRYTKSDDTVDFVRLVVPTKNAANATPVVGPLVINEIMYNPATGKPEFLELHNISANPVSLNDGTGTPWWITGEISYAFLVSETIPAGGYGLLVEGTDGGNAVAEAAAFRSAHSVDAAVPIFIYTPLSSGKLDNNGGTVSLEMPSPNLGNPQSYVMIDSVDYLDAAPWPDVADGSGSSLMRQIPDDYGNDVANWQAGRVGGTPGIPNQGLDMTPPTVPTHLTGRVHSSAQIRLFWNISTDDQSGVSTYNVYRNDLLIGTTPIPLFTDNIPPDVSLSYNVSAVNTTGSESGLSSPFLTGSQVFEFQQGSLPDDAYSGAKDTQLSEQQANTNLEASAALKIDGDFATGSNLTNNLISYWPFDGDTAPTAVDQSGREKNLVLMGDATIDVGGGLIGDALRLPTNIPGNTGGSGVHGWAKSPGDDNDYDFGTSDSTIQLWVNYANTSDESVLIENSGNLGGWNITSFPQLSATSGVSPGNVLYDPAIGVLNPVFAADSGWPHPSGWHHVVARRQGDDFSLFLNGTLQNTVSGPDVAVIDDVVPLVLGYRATPGDNRGFAFRGAYDEVAVWHRAISDAEIDSLYNNGSGRALDDFEEIGTGLDVSALLKWDVSAIPSGSVVTGSSMTFDVTQETVGPYQIRQVLRDWSENHATWNQFASGQDWQSPGAMGAADRGATLSTVSSTGTGFYTANLNFDGLALVQSWVNGTQPNYGVLITNSTTPDGLEITSSEGAVSTNRPKLTVTTAATPNPGITGDLNNDQLVNAADIDLLNRAIAVSHHDVALDLDSNAGTDTADADKLVQTILSTNYGDTDLDKDIDTSDLTTAIINFTSAGGSGKGWATGDTDGDGDVDTSDLTTAIINFTGALAVQIPNSETSAVASMDRSLVMSALENPEQNILGTSSYAEAAVLLATVRNADPVTDQPASEIRSAWLSIVEAQSLRTNSKRQVGDVWGEEIDWLSNEPSR